MKKLKLEDSTARRLYPTASPEFKLMLEETFGKDFFSVSITDRIKTYDDACNELGIIPINDNKMTELGFTQDEIYFRKIKTITEALNEGWKPDWSNSDQNKYFPWFRMSPGGFVFGDACYGSSRAGVGDASRLCFKSSDLAKYAGQQFLKLYSDFILYY